jgi:TetR/AcrR family transcriptional regulator
MQRSETGQPEPAEATEPTPTADPTAAAKPDTAARLLDAAEAVFAECGFAGTTTSAIAERAGVTKALVHYYYRSKESLHLAVMERFKERIGELLFEDLGQGEPTVALDNCLRRYCGFLAEHPAYVRLNLYNALEETCQLTKMPLFRKLIDETTAALRRGMEVGIFREIDPLHLLVSIDALCSFFFEHEKEIRKLWGEEHFDRERLVEEHIEHVVHMVMWAICAQEGEGEHC